jgi:hypothetical protein
MFSNEDTVSISHLSRANYIASPSHPPRFDHLNNIWWPYKLRSSSFCSLPHAPATSSILCPNTLCHTLNIKYSQLLKIFQVTELAVCTFKTLTN